MSAILNAAKSPYPPGYVLHLAIFLYKRLLKNTSILKYNYIEIYIMEEHNSIEI